MVRVSLLCLAIAVSGCTGTSPSREGLSQLQLEAEANIRAVRIDGADVTVLSTNELTRINNIAGGMSGAGPKRVQILNVLQKAGAI